MSILRKTSVNQLETLFNLFPIKALKEGWNDVKGNKIETALEIAADRDLDKYANFLHRNISRCKQHIYILETDIDGESLLNMDLNPLEFLTYSADDSLKITYVDKIQVEIIITDPLQKTKVEYLIPIQIELFNSHLIIKFVKFEKSIKASGINQGKVFINKDNHEERIVAEVIRSVRDAGFQIKSCDFHKGIKHLWDSDIIDSSVVNYKDAQSTERTKMDDNRGVKKYNKKKYEEVIKISQLFSCLFETIVVDGQKPLYFTADCTRGFISFNKYSEDAQENEYVVREIIINNI